jgi:hypothetical protein
MGNCIGKKSRTSNKHHHYAPSPSQPLSSMQINVLPSEQSNHNIEQSLFSKEKDQEIKSGKLYFQT